MDKMTANKKNLPIFDPGLCRCCGSIKKCRLLNGEYQFMGENEIYSDMMMDCFGLLLSHLDSKQTERLVCATCVVRLRDAVSFRKQVLQCEEAFLKMKIYDDEHSGSDNKNLSLQVERVKTEPQDIISTGSPQPLDLDDRSIDIQLNNDSSNDDIPLSERIKEKRLKIKRKIIKSPIKTKRSKTTGNKKENNINHEAKIPMSMLQQINREKDQSYLTETNILNIVEYSYVCPFKCRHNNLLCYYCGKLCKDPDILRQHTSSQHHPKKFKVIEHTKPTKIDITKIDCRLCTETIDNLEDFKLHITRVHNKTYYFNTKLAYLPFRLTQNDINCVLCDQKYPYFHALNKHMNVHFSNYVCETCGLGFVDKYRFLMHQQRHESGDFPCETCGKIFRAQNLLDLHIDRVHKKKGRVYCPKCDMKLMTYAQKLKHLVEVHGEEPLSFPCTLCDKVFVNRRSLTIHKRRDHMKDFRYNCQYCGQKFFTRFALTNHMPTHTGERNYKCKVCEKTYPRLKTLKDHMRIHTNDRRFRCHVCGQAFIQNCSLKGHIKSQHPEYG